MPVQNEQAFLFYSIEMKTTLFLLLISTFAAAQTNSEKFKAEILAGKDLIKPDVKKEIMVFDIACLLTRTENTSVLGYIGPEYERIRIKFISVIKDKDHPDQYFVYGKSMVKDNVCEFQGTLKIINAFYVKSTDEKRGVLLGEYLFYENPAQKHVGQFKGACSINWYFNKEGKIQYDDLEGGADGFSNNSFVVRGLFITVKPQGPATGVITEYQCREI